MQQVLNAAAQQAIWSFREAALGLVDRDEDGRQGDLVRRRHRGRAGEAARLHRAIHRASCERHNTIAGVYAHASVGCLHVRPVVNLKTADGVAKFEAIANEVADLVLEFGGALSGEHGDGLVRGAFNEKMFGSELYQAFRQVKKTFDPQRPLQSRPHRRHAADHVASAIRRRLHDAVAGDIFRFLGSSRLRPRRRDVQRCRAVPQEARRHDVPVVHGHARRGAFDARPREHAAARDGRTAWRREALGRGVHEVMDLCLECRACKSECPVGVDVARFKSEFLAGYWDRHGMSLTAHVFGSAHAAAVWGSRFAPMSNRLRTPDRRDGSRRN